MMEITAESEERRIKLSRLQYAYDNYERASEKIKRELESDLTTYHQKF
jgi:hypothetical protein